MYFFLMIRRSPISTLFPYTTLFRSGPSILGLVLPSSDLHVLSNLAVFFLMFFAGLDLDPREIRRAGRSAIVIRSEEHTSELQSRQYIVCRLLLEKTTLNRISSFRFG